MTRNLHHADFWQFYLTLPWPLPKPEELAHLYQDDEWATLLVPRLQAAHDYNQQQLSIPLAQILAAD